MTLPPPSDDDEIAAIRERLVALDAERTALESRLAGLLTLQMERPIPAPPPSSSTAGTMTGTASPAIKIALFRSLFRGREDVFPKRWSNPRSGKSGYSPACANEWVPRLCGKPKVKCGDCPNRHFLPVTDTVIAQHLRGEGSDGRDFIIGVYPMLADETCWFLAADFDKKSWRDDVAAFLETCRIKNIPTAVERSRSGNGGHVWIFFAEPVPAGLARRLGAHILTETMERAPELGFDSYDRFFPNQDTMPAGGFGNLIALPLQRRPREAGNSVFLDDQFEPHPDQWQYLSGVRRMTLAEVSTLTDEASRQGRILGVRLPIDDDDEEPWLAPPSRRKPEAPVSGPLPETVDMVLGNQVYIDRTALPPALVNRLVRLAAFQNPEFYSAQAMRLPIFDIPRIIGCAELPSHHVALPRGCRDQAEALLTSLGIGIRCRDERYVGQLIDANFTGTLTLEQQAAADALLRHDTGVLAATTAFGKTVVAAHLIAARKTNTLVLVHRRQLLDQWIARLSTFLDLPPKSIGQIGGGKRKPTGIVDVAVIQSLARKGEVDDIVGEYGHLIIDECHHLSAVSFEAVARRCKAKYVLGLSATVTRKDGHHPIIFMQCGPVRFRVDAKRQAAQRPFGHRVILRQTGFTLPVGMNGDRLAIQDVYNALARDEPRNTMIFDDVLKALEGGRSPVVLTERKEHALLLAERLSRFARNVIVLHGGMGVKARRAQAEQLAAIADTEERVLIATGRYIGEGFDDARLDTLFLTMPISWRGTLAQYAGRLHRLHPGKREVIIYDYVDEAVPVLARMSGKRIKGYDSLGYSVGKTQP
ncbi:Putative helicase [Magnetospirillum gryphiswaldense MSR-1 v2]|uniref:Helicase n=1 Tax=Magnetospirillum gryphiswaldense (strain DSM 6361 / JCM 21280 / NBRC 15271 / MSR-1) TaxID=431944 RepID=V6F8H3_MAGGM|nr:DEAD/DEAH box helicase [Magnetospirillum gryphiswaldense]CDL00978.1 Putative helicase [Magnetospirillum gryphiswaldense MSR-1 v2]